MANEVISYLEMCSREGTSLQRGMNFGLSSDHSVVLMSLRSLMALAMEADVVHNNSTDTRLRSGGSCVSVAEIWQSSFQSRVVRTRSRRSIVAHVISSRRVSHVDNDHDLECPEPQAERSGLRRQAQLPRWDPASSRLGRRSAERDSRFGRAAGTRRQARFPPLCGHARRSREPSGIPHPQRPYIAI